MGGQQKPGERKLEEQHGKEFANLGKPVQSGNLSGGSFLLNSTFNRDLNQSEAGKATEVERSEIPTRFSASVKWMR